MRNGTSLLPIAALSKKAAEGKEAILRVPGATLENPVYTSSAADTLTLNDRPDALRRRSVA